MPRKIDNRELYLKLMSKSFYDKAWFLKNLPDDVETIVDFGGGAGEFAEFAQRLPEIMFIMLSLTMILSFSAARSNVAG